MLMLIMILDNVAHRNDVLQAWIDAGITGVTILESTGINRVLQRHKADAAFAGFSQLFSGGSVGHNTLLAVIDSLDTAEAAVAATERVIGDLNEPSTGIIFAVPVIKLWGADHIGSGHQDNPADGLD
jgi:hypothetical protein